MNLTMDEELDSSVDMDMCYDKEKANPVVLRGETERILPNLPRKLPVKHSNLETEITRFPRKSSNVGVIPAEENFLGLFHKTSIQRGECDANSLASSRLTYDSSLITSVTDTIDKTELSGGSGYFSASSGFLSGNTADHLSQEFGDLNLKECASQDSGQGFAEYSDPANETELDENFAETIKEIYQQDQDGDTHLHTAVITLQTSIAITFINMSPNQKWLDIPNALLQTPLHLAVLTKQIGVVRRLMVGGASLTCQDIKGNTPLHLACMMANSDSVGVLLQPLTYTECKVNRYDPVYQAIPQDLEIKNYNGQTCLHVSAELGFTSLVDILLSKGANINSQDGKSGRCILHYAVEAGNKELLTFLLQRRGINISATTYGDQTAIQLAYGRNMHEFVKTLHECGANMYEEDM